ncbi:MAG: acyl-CoA dehydrogenase family protein [Planctomycetota bacterium]|jgi:butyryl-CoA dehydrogenase
MNFDLTEDQKMIQDTARDVSEKVLAPRAAELDRTGEFPRENLKALAELGFMGILVPEAYEGAGLGNLELVLILEQVNRACAATGVTLSVHNSLASGALVLFGNEEQKKAYLPKLASGEWLGAYGLTEPEVGSDAASIALNAKKDGNAYILNGTKVMITSGAHADLAVVYCRTGPGQKAKGISAFLVEKGTPGFAVGQKEEKTGIRASDTSELVFEDCRVPAANLLGEVGKGFKIAMTVLDGGRIGIAAQSLGIGLAALEASVKYAQERVQFGKPIAEFQAVQWKIAEMASQLDASRLLTYRAAWLRDMKRPHTREASMAKLMASEAVNEAARQAVQIHGGAGYTTEFPVERLFRDARITTLYEGTSEVQKIVISRSYLS